ncbi:MAG TPA: host-nuclease inhibitor Gam family protein, partial [Opitutaceae bacterium]|nr:host-nuclease inhibitor Gam family protein [Opitutaceae bacterium]
MPKPTRIKAPSIATRVDFDAAIDALARNEVSLRIAEARRDAKIQDVREQFEGEIVSLTEMRDALALATEKYAREHRDEVLPGKLKSAETPLATFGFRLGQPTLKLLNRQWSWEKVMEALTARGLAALIRTKREPDKEALHRLP